MPGVITPTTVKTPMMPKMKHPSRIRMYHGMSGSSNLNVDFCALAAGASTSDAVVPAVEG